MRTPGSGFAIDFARHHRWGFLAIAGYLAGLAIVGLLIRAAGQHTYVGSTSFGLGVITPLSLSCFYLLVVFSYGYAGDVAGRASLYPARLFTLPVGTATLVNWPMLYGALVMALLWLASALLAFRPAGVRVPLLWPAVFFAVFMAWEQVVMWLPLGLRGLRVILAVTLLVLVDTGMLVAITLKLSQAHMLLLLLPQIPLAYVAAWYAVTMARRGHVPDWSIAFRNTVGRSPARVLPPFRDAAEAQTWLEWRQHGRALPGMVAAVVPFELALLFLTRETGLALEILIGVLLTPPLLAAFAARGFHGLTTFAATRPVGDTAILSAKFRATLRSTLLAWLLVFALMPAALLLSHRLALVAAALSDLRHYVGTARAAVFSALVVVAAMASTWKQLVQSLYIGLSGRPWLMRASMTVMLALLVTVVPLADWVRQTAPAATALWDALPWIVGALVALKMAIAFPVVIRLVRSRSASDGLVMAGAAVWLVCVLTLHGTLVWLTYGPLVPHYFLALLAILAVPLVRLSAAPLALAGNRHQ